MAVRLSRASGNWLTAGTWGLVDSTSYNNSESATTALTTSYQASSGSTTGAITVAGIALKLAVRTGTTGTMSVHLAIAGVEVTGTLVTINVSDLPVAATADLNGGWHFFKFASSVTLSAATSYTVEAKTSSSSQVSLRSSSGSNWSRALVTTTTGVPAAGDDVIICGEYLSAGSSNIFTVTLDETATTDYGAASTSLVTPAIAICSHGILKSQISSSTNYNLKVSGHIIIYSGGEFDIGTVGSEMPRDSSFTLLFDCVSNVNFGLTVRNLGSFVTQGLSRTSGKDIYHCKLNANAAANATSLTVDTDTGWLDNDVIAIASTTRTAADSESGTLNGNAGASSLTVDGFAGTGGGLAVAHSGTSPTQGEIILLTRNILIKGVSATVQSYINIFATAIVDCDWTEFKWLGSNTTNQRGIDTACTTGIQSFQYCSMHNFEVSSSRGLNMTGTSGTGLTFSNNVMWLVHSEMLINLANTGSSIFDGNFFIKNGTGQNSAMISLGDIGCTFTNNTIVGCFNSNLSLTETNGIIGTFSGNTIHSSRLSGIAINIQFSGTLTNTTIWRTNSNGITISVLLSDIIFDTLTMFGCSGSSILLSGTGLSLDNVTFISFTSNGDTTFSTTNGIDNPSGSSVLGINLINCNFSTVSGIKTAHTTDITITAPQAMKVKMFNTILAASNEFSSFSNMTGSSYISSQNHDSVAGTNKTWKKYGIISIETTTTHTGSTSIKMTPSSATFKLESSGPYGGFKVAVSNGSTLTPVVYVYEDATYNGNRSRLILKRNDAIGITSETVLATATAASDLAWEQLTGTTIAATSDGVMEFIVDCDGTAGNLFVDSFSVS